MSKRGENKRGRAAKRRPTVQAPTSMAQGATSTARNAAKPPAKGQTQAHAEVMPKYAALMEGIKDRITALDNALPGLLVGDVGDLAKLQTIAVLLRQILEAIAFASLVFNKETYDQVHQDAANQWSAKRLLDKIEKLNPRFYPSPVIDTPQDGQQREIVHKTSGFLTRQEYVTLYDECSKIIHQRNPLNRSLGYTRFAKAIPEWRKKIIELLNAHELWLQGDSGFYIVHMQDAEDGHVHWYRFELVGNPT